MPLYKGFIGSTQHKRQRLTRLPLYWVSRFSYCNAECVVLHVVMLSIVKPFKRQSWLRLPSGGTFGGDIWWRDRFIWMLDYFSKFWRFLWRCDVDDDNYNDDNCKRRFNQTFPFPLPPFLSVCFNTFVTREGHRDKKLFFAIFYAVKIWCNKLVRSWLANI